LTNITDWEEDKPLLEVDSTDGWDGATISLIGAVGQVLGRIEAYILASDAPGLRACW
jgi:hypothetical protein